MARASDNPFPSALFVEGSAPTSPASGDQRIFIDVADHKLKRKNSSGTVTTIEGGGGGGMTDPETTAGDMIIHDASNVLARLPVGSVGQVLGVAGGTPIPTYQNGGMVQLVSTVLGSNTASISFTSISGSYSALLIEYVVRSTSAGSALDTLLCRFNTDSAANYDYQNAADSGSSIAGGETFGATSIRCGLCVQNGAGAGLAAAGSILIPEYADTSFNKTLNATVSSKTGTSTTNLRNERNAGFWRSSSAITQIDLLPGSGSFLAGSKFRLYGMV